MLSIKDLAASKSLDTKAMRMICGGTRAALFGFESIFKPSNQFGTQESLAQAFTGPQSNATFQNDNDVLMAAPGSQLINTGGNYSTSSNTAHVAATSIPVLFQSA